MEGKKGKAGSFTDNAHLVFDAVNNFDQAEGTIAMWINPYWSQLDGMPHCFFEAPVLPAMALDGGFVITKGFSANVNPNATYFYNSPGDHGICCDLGLVPNEWTHLAFSWSVSKQTMKAYRNGELVVIAQHPITPRPKSAGRPLVIGARAGGRSPESVKKMRRDFGAAGGCSAEAAIDELMIFNAPLSDAEIARLADGASKTAPAQKSEPLDSSHMNALKMELETPHIAFNRPSRWAPVRSLFVVANGSSRDVVELAQRYDTAFTAVVVQDQFNLGYDDFCCQKWAKLSPADKAAELAARLDEKPEVIVLGSFDFSRIPAPLQKRILGMVSEGTGLVLVPPLNPPAAITQVSDAGRTAISSGVPWAALCDLYPKANLDPRRLSEKVVQAYTHGKGRVVILRWQDITASSSPEFGIAPHTAGAVVDRQYEHRYNYYLSLVGKAIHWAGGRESKVQWTELPAEGREHQTQDWPAKGVAVQLKWTGNDGQAVEMRAVLRDTSGRIESQQDRNVRLSTGVNSLLITLPAPPAGASLFGSDRVGRWQG